MSATFAPSEFVSWRRTNTVAGYTLFGLPAVFGIVAAISTLAAFGFAVVDDIVLPFAAVTAPLLLWLRYTGRRPTTMAGKGIWAFLAFAMFLLLAMSPIWFWAGPVSLLLLSEGLRIVAEDLLLRFRTGRGRSRPQQPRRVS